MYILYIRQIWSLGSLRYFSIVYVVKVYKMAIIPFKRFCVLDNKI